MVWEMVSIEGILSALHTLETLSLFYMSKLNNITEIENNFYKNLTKIDISDCINIKAIDLSKQINLREVKIS